MEAGQGNLVFKQSLAQLNVPDLKNLCWNLFLSEDGLKAELLKRVQDYFTAHPEMKALKRYAALFPRSKKRARNSDQNQIPSPVSRPESPTQRLRFSPSAPSPIASLSRTVLEDITPGFIPVLPEYPSFCYSNALCCFESSVAED
ncbi:hypothetical protein PM082_013367 [Marasmius tenuissimus]|nr:hypothetical protein PM082_013367 [Marasmius tenuissimus]